MIGNNFTIRSQQLYNDVSTIQFKTKNIKHICMKTSIKSYFNPT